MSIGPCLCGDPYCPRCFPGSCYREEKRPARRKLTDRQRRLAIVADLSALHCEPRLSEANVEAVLEILVRHSCTWADFRDLDEKPGRYPGYCDGRPEWAWKLRQVRNQHGKRLAEVLGAFHEFGANP